eukprot:COSAG04_NODE_30939_length_259_cov_1.612500_2_plen_31_part_01
MSVGREVQTAGFAFGGQGNSELWLRLWLWLR